MPRTSLSYDELTPLEQCIENRFLFAQMLRTPPDSEEETTAPKKTEH
jgi:hypothetical protein